MCSRVLWTAWVLILPRRFPLLVIKSRLVHQLFECFYILILPYQKHTGHSYKQQCFAKEVPHLVNKAYPSQAIHKIGHKETNHCSTTCIRFTHALLVRFSKDVSRGMYLRTGKKLLEIGYEQTIEKFSFREMESLHPCPPRNNGSVEKHRFFITWWLWVIFQPFPSPNLCKWIVIRLLLNQAISYE